MPEPPLNPPRSWRRAARRGQKAISSRSRPTKISPAHRERTASSQNSGRSNSGTPHDTKCVNTEPLHAGPRRDLPHVLGRPVGLDDVTHERFVAAADAFHDATGAVVDPPRRPPHSSLTPPNPTHATTPAKAMLH